MAIKIKQRVLIMMIQSLLDRWRRGQSASANVIACGYFWSCIGQLESRSSVREYQSYGSTCPNRQRGYLVFAEVRTNHFGFVDSWTPRSYGVFSCVEGGSVTPFCKHLLITYKRVPKHNGSGCNSSFRCRAGSSDHRADVREYLQTQHTPKRAVAKRATA